MSICMVAAIPTLLLQNQPKLEYCSQSGFGQLGYSYHKEFRIFWQVATGELCSHRQKASSVTIHKSPTCAKFTPHAYTELCQCEELGKFCWVFQDRLASSSSKWSMGKSFLFVVFLAVTQHLGQTKSGICEWVRTSLVSLIDSIISEYMFLQFSKSSFAVASR